MQNCSNNNCGHTCKQPLLTLQPSLDRSSYLVALQSFVLLIQVAWVNWPCYYWRRPTHLELEPASLRSHFFAMHCVYLTLIRRPLLIRGKVHCIIHHLPGGNKKLPHHGDIKYLVYDISKTSVNTAFLPCTSAGSLHLMTGQPLSHSHPLLREDCRQ